MQLKRVIYACALAALLYLPSVSSAQPRILQDDIQVQKILTVPERTMRIVKDPRDGTLYTLTAQGDISRIRIPSPDLQLEQRIARGVRNADGVFTWTYFNLEGDIPANVPIEALQTAVANGARSSTNPVDGKLYVLNTDDASILVLPRTVIASASDFNLPYVSALFIDANGAFYVSLDVARANAPQIERVYSSSDHGLNDTQGLAIGPDGSMYVGGNQGQRNANSIVIAKGLFDPATGQHAWSELARSEPIPKGDVGAFNHFHPGLAIDPAGRNLFINSGSRTEHGELAEMDGLYPDLREAPITSAILRIPTEGDNIVIPTEAQALAASGFLFSDGHRNAFDLSIGPEGELFSVDNGPDWDMSDEINWVRPGLHYGFPWRMGSYDNPQQFSNYDPSNDPLLQNNSWARQNNLFYNDPTYPPPPTGVQFADPIINLGPDANSYRTLEGQILDGSDTNEPVFTLTAHSSPLGLVFDNDQAMAPPYKGSGFVLRIGGSIASLINSFEDPDQDLLHIDLEKTPNGDNYQARVTRLVGGFDSPIDAEIVDNRIYVIEWGNTRGLWEVVLPAETRTAVVEIEGAGVPERSALSQNYPNPFNPNTTIEYSLDRTEPVQVAIFDALGQKVRTLVDAHQRAGYYRLQWDGQTDSGKSAASGVYIYRLQTPSHRESRQLTLLK